MAQFPSPLIIAATPAQAPPPDSNLKTNLNDLYHQAQIRVEPNVARHLQPLLSQPLDVFWNYRMRSCAGRAWGGETIQLNARLLSQNPTELPATFLHELAHIWGHRLFQARGHGQAWQTLMAWMEQPIHRTHRMDVSRLAHRQKAFAYRCQCQQHWLKTKRHHKVLQGQIYTCRRCLAPLIQIPESC